MGCRATSRSETRISEVRLRSLRRLKRVSEVEAEGEKVWVEINSKAGVFSSSVCLRRKACWTRNAETMAEKEKFMKL